MIMLPELLLLTMSLSSRTALQVKTQITNHVLIVLNILMFILWDVILVQMINSILITELVLKRRRDILTLMIVIGLPIISLELSKREIKELKNLELKFVKFNILIMMDLAVFLVLQVNSSTMTPTTVNPALET